MTKIPLYLGALLLAGVASAAEVKKVATSCSEYIDGYRYDLSSLKGSRFEVPAKDGQTLIFGVCEGIDGKNAVAYLKRTNKDDKIIGSLETDQEWKALTEEDEELGGFKHIGAQLTYYQNDSEKSKSSQWIFRQRLLCSLDNAPALKGFNVDYNDRIATVDISAAAACPVAQFSTPSFIRRHWFAMLMGAIGASLMLGLSSGLSYSTYAALIGFVFGFFTVGYIWMSSVLHNGVWSTSVATGQSTTPGTWMFLHSVFGFLLASAAAGACAFFFSQFPTFAVTLGGIFAGGGFIAVCEGFFHFFTRGVLGISKSTLGWTELVFSFLGMVIGGALCYENGPSAIPILASVLGAYGITWTIGFLTDSLPRQANIFAHFQSLGRIFGLSGGDQKTAWWPIRGRLSLLSAFLLWAVFLTSMIGFLVVHISAYKGLHRARDGGPVRFHGGVEEPAGNFFEDAGHGRELEASSSLRKLWYDFKQTLHNWFPSVFSAPGRPAVFASQALEEQRNEAWAPNYNAGNVRTPLLNKKNLPTVDRAFDESTRGSGGNDNASKNYANVAAAAANQNPQDPRSTTATPMRDQKDFGQTVDLTHKNHK